MRRENVEKKQTKKTKKEQKITVKSYLRDFLLFVDKNLLKTVGILFVVAILLTAVSLKPIVTDILSLECEGTCRDGVGILSEYGSKMQVLLVTAFAGIVPYIFAPVVGFIGYVLSEVSSFAYIIKGYGYAAGIAMGIVPMIINLLIICIVAALGIYICRTVTVGYKISSVKNMNFTNFRIKLYEVLQNEKKVKEFTEKRDKKLAKLQDKKEKINYLQILNVAIIVSILQFISVLVQEIIL